jgi:hypothetical protein
LFEVRSSNSSRRARPAPRPSGPRIDSDAPTIRKIK